MLLHFSFVDTCPMVAIRTSVVDASSSSWRSVGFVVFVSSSCFGVLQTFFDFTYLLLLLSTLLLAWQGWLCRCWSADCSGANVAGMRVCVEAAPCIAKNSSKIERIAPSLLTGRAGAQRANWDLSHLRQSTCLSHNHTSQTKSILAAHLAERHDIFQLGIRTTDIMSDNAAIEKRIEELEAEMARTQKNKVRTYTQKVVSFISWHVNKRRVSAPFCWCRSPFSPTIDGSNFLLHCFCYFYD